MAISIDELRINDIVLSPKNDIMRRCMVKAIHNDSVSVEILNMQTGKMECEELDCDELEPVHLMESTLHAFGFRKTENRYYGSPTNICYVLKREGNYDIIPSRPVNGIFSSLVIMVRLLISMNYTCIHFRTFCHTMKRLLMKSAIISSLN